MARNRIIGRETQKMQEYTQEQINQAESRGIEISTDVKEQLFEYANLIGEKEKVRALVRNLAVPEYPFLRHPANPLHLLNLPGSLHLPDFLPKP